MVTLKMQSVSPDVYAQSPYFAHSGVQSVVRAIQPVNRLAGIRHRRGFCTLIHAFRWTSFYNKTIFHFLFMTASAKTYLSERVNHLSVMGIQTSARSCNHRAWRTGINYASKEKILSTVSLNFPFSVSKNLLT